MVFDVTRAYGRVFLTIAGVDVGLIFEKACRLESPCLVYTVAYRVAQRISRCADILAHLIACPRQVGAQVEIEVGSDLLRILGA